ncbi:MAG: UDP-glucose/GDP-mannose dehydrogenase family protein [Planctomycetota bacterium]|nr:UDP-glucose/GDP-mannose dehydrogenase family protein [Planctomycetota bacterium]
MNITIVGTGYVGLVTGACFAKIGHNCLCIDNDQSKISSLQAGEIPFYEPGLSELVTEMCTAGRLTFSTDSAEGVQRSPVIFIAVGTPATPSGKADLSYIEQVARTIAQSMNEYKVVVEKSTVPVQTGERVRMTIDRHISSEIPFDVASNPEFLREGSAIEDALHPDRIVLGVESERAESLLREVYAPLDAPILVTNIGSAEIIKHASNSFLAMKISYANALSQICELANADIDEVARGVGLDRRIGENFLRAGVGYGGSCFPKDVDAFCDIASELGYEFRLLQEVQAINREQRRYFLRKIEDALWIVKEKTVTIFGLSFKPNTDDLRQAPSLDVIEWLLEHGAKVHAHDPKAIPAMRKLYGDRIRYFEDPYEAAQDADCVAILTEWQIYGDLDLTRLKDSMKQAVMVDGRNLFDPQEVIGLGFEYKSIGRR